MDFDSFFHQIMSTDPLSERRHPYPYQQKLAVEPWPEIIDVPTGLGKTAAVTAAWLYKRLNRDVETPRRLLWCFPMRVLVEQTRDAVQHWLERAGPFFESQGMQRPSCYVLMGGHTDDKWVERPEDPSIIIGTQDMLLSRALMRGYGMSRYRWPMDFALVHHDALWVFDEVQLMGAGLATSAQLEAFRREWADAFPTGSRSLWLSATLQPEWLSTVDFRDHVGGLRVLRLSDADMDLPPVRRRREASKSVNRTDIVLTGNSKADVNRYVETLAQRVFAAHEADGPTLAIVNNVTRAQQLAEHLRTLAGPDESGKILLVHSRFRPAERERINSRIRGLQATDDIIIVATQAIEAGVDLTAKRLFTELAPWSSLVQRFGRCNRGGEYNEGVSGGQIYWIDLDVEAKPELAYPYHPGQLREARAVIQALSSGAPADLPAVEDELPLTHVIRRRDFVELFNTDPDLSGHDVDISHYLRDGGQPEVHVFWREFDDRPIEEPGPSREELCPVSIGQLRTHLDKRDDMAFVWDGLLERWVMIAPGWIRPGQLVLLRASDGGYDVDLGFVTGVKGKASVPIIVADDKSPLDSIMGDPETQIGSFVSLASHSAAAHREAERLCLALGEVEGRTAVLQAALWHDIGKAHEAAQTAYRDFAKTIDTTFSDTELWAKTPGRGRLRYRLERDGKVQARRYFRHELASALAWLAHVPRDSDHDLVAYLIAAHHGKVRLGIRSMPDEATPEDGRKFARGVWEGDVLPGVSLGAESVPPLEIRLDVMEMGDGPQGPSWTSRTRRLLRQLGPFRLAWLETLVRLADWRASAMTENTKSRGSDETRGHLGKGGAAS